MKEPWQMTRSEWEAEREAVRPNIAQSHLTRSSGSEAASRIARLEWLLYGVNDAARAEIEAAMRGAKTIAPERADALMDQINGPVTHRQVVEKAMAEGLPVPASAVASYPDMRGAA